MSAPVITDLSVSLDGWSASMGSTPTIDENGCAWILSELDGWFGGVGVRSAPVDRLTVDGTIDGLRTFGARVITIGGSVVAPDRGSLMQAMDRIAGVLAGRSRTGTLLVNEEARQMYRQALVTLDADTKVAVADRLRATFSLALYAADPARYSTSTQQVQSLRYTPGGLFTIPLTVPIVFGPPGASGFLTINNNGNQDAWPVFRFVGPLVNPTVRLVGDRAISVVISLAAGQELVIDSKGRTVMLGASSRRGFLSFDSAWFSLPPGSSQLYFSADSGSGTLTVQWRDAWA